MDNNIKCMKTQELFLGNLDFYGRKPTAAMYNYD